MLLLVLGRVFPYTTSRLVLGRVYIYIQFDSHNNEFLSFCRHGDGDKFLLVSLFRHAAEPKTCHSWPRNGSEISLRCIYIYIILYYNILYYIILYYIILYYIILYYIYILYIYIILYIIYIYMYNILHILYIYYIYIYYIYYICYILYIYTLEVQDQTKNGL